MPEITRKNVYFNTIEGNLAAADPWLASHAYAVGNTCATTDVNGNNKNYRCTVAGTSAASGGPTGTGTSIVDGGARWDYMGPGHFIFAPHFGIFWMNNVFISGADSEAGIVEGSSFLQLPNTAVTSPDGVVITNTSTSYFDVGLSVRHGLANWFVSNSWFDGCKTTGLDFQVTTSCQGIKFSNCHLAGVGGGAGVLDAPNTAVGIRLAASGGGLVKNFAFTGGQIFNFDQNAVRMVGNVDNVIIANNVMFNNAIDSAEATSSQIHIDAAVGTFMRNIDVSHNIIYKETTAGSLPDYGIKILSDGTHVRVQNNNIEDVGVATILNSSRGSAATRKISGNSGQVVEGQMRSLGPFTAANLGTGTTQLSDSRPGCGFHDGRVGEALSHYWRNGFRQCRHHDIRHRDVQHSEGREHRAFHAGQWDYAYSSRGSCRHRGHYPGDDRGFGDDRWLHARGYRLDRLRPRLFRLRWRGECDGCRHRSVPPMADATARAP